MGILKKLTGQMWNQPTLFAVDIPVNRSHLRADTEKGKMTHGTYGPGLKTPLAFLDPVSQSWKMYKVTSRLGELPSLKKLPTSGMTVNGVLYQRPAWAPVIEGTGLSLWPTPVAAGGLDGGSHSRASMRKLIGTPYEVPSTGKLNPTWVEWLMGFPEGWTDLKG